MSKRNFKRLVVIADTHCGHMFGLTPPQWWLPRNPKGFSPRVKNKPRKIADTQRRMWGGYCATLNELKPIDYLAVNGDAIDGKAERSGGTELITTDREEQAHMAAQCISQAECARIFMTYGTPYHTGVDEDWESLVGDLVQVEEIGSHVWLDINGLTFDFKHFIGSSSIPHGRGTSIARDRLWNMLWAEREEQPLARILIRSHVHYYVAYEERMWRGIITPALQAAGTKFGARRQSGTVDMGLVYFDVYDDGSYTWQPRFLRRGVRKAKATKLT